MSKAITPQEALNILIERTKYNIYNEDISSVELSNIISDFINQLNEIREVVKELFEVKDNFIYLKHTLNDGKMNLRIKSILGNE